MRRFSILVFGIVSYTVGMLSLVYMIGWLGNLVVPHSIDSPAIGNPLTAVACNLCLFMLFGLQHSVMARPSFKSWWTKYIPQEIERSVYVLLSGLLLVLVMLLWTPMGIVIWDIKHLTIRTFLHCSYGMGWLILVGSTFALNHFELFGLRQVWLAWKNKDYESLPFSVPGPYKLVRHPIYVGWITLAWVTPTMSLAHLTFALAATTYILIAIIYEERDLVKFHGQNYTEYQKHVPMLVPNPALLSNVRQQPNSNLMVDG